MSGKTFGRGMRGGGEGFCCPLGQGRRWKGVWSYLESKGWPCGRGSLYAWEKAGSEIVSEWSGWPGSREQVIWYLVKFQSQVEGRCSLSPTSLFQLLYLLLTHTRHSPPPFRSSWQGQGCLELS